MHMNRYVMVGVGLLAMLAAGCQDGGKPVEIRLHAENTAGYEFLELGIQDLRVFMGDKELQVVRGGRLGDLLNPDSSPLLGTVRIPDTAAEVRVLVRLDDYGAFATGASAGYVRVKDSPITFTSPVKAMRQRDHVVVHLDVARSLALTSRDEERAFIPNLNVRY